MEFVVSEQFIVGKEFRGQEKSASTSQHIECMNHIDRAKVHLSRSSKLEK